MMMAINNALVLALIFFRDIVIEAAIKSRPKGDITKDQMQSSTPGSNYEHTPELPGNLEKSRRKTNSPPREFQKEIDCDVSFK